jgi:PEP-CTERM motif
MTVGSLRRAVCAAAFVSAVAYAGPAHAALVTVDSVGDSFGVVFNGNVEQQNVADLSAEATFLVTGFTGNSITFDVTLENTTGSLGSGLGSRVSSLGFDTTPNITGASSSGVFNIAVLGGSYPNQFGDIEVCFKDGGGPNNCEGGGSGGVANPNSGVFTLVLNFAGPITQFEFDRFGVRYQSIDGAGFMGASGTGEGHIPGDPTPRDVPGVPEPTTMVLLGTGLLGLVRRLRRS